MCANGGLNIKNYFLLRTEGRREIRVLRDTYLIYGRSIYTNAFYDTRYCREGNHVLSQQRMGKRGAAGERNIYKFKQGNRENSITVTI